MQNLQNSPVKSNTIKSILIDRDNLSEDEAESLIEEARKVLLDRLAQGQMPFDICEEFFSLEPDYLEELI